MIVEREMTPTDPLIGCRVGGRYRIDGVLGWGGMGTVYEAVQLALDRPVALKVLGEAWAHDVDALARFEREARTTSQLDHGNIVAVTDVGFLPDGRPYLVMPQLQGIDLAEYMRRHTPLPAARVVELLGGVAAALDLVHARGVVHRDIKPSNMMYVQRQGDSERVQLLDFGIATLTQVDARITHDGLVYGTPAYVAPEAAMGQAVDGRADVYSLATVVFEMLTGRLPFPDEGVMASLSARVTRDAPSLAEASGVAFDPELERVLGGGLARQAGARYASAGAFIAELATAAGCPRASSVVSLRSSGVMTRPPGGAPRPADPSTVVRPRQAPPRPPAREPSHSSGASEARFAQRLRRSQRHWWWAVAGAALGIGTLGARSSGVDTGAPGAARGEGSTGVQPDARSAAVVDEDPQGVGARGLDTPPLSSRASQASSPLQGGAQLAAASSQDPVQTAQEDESAPTGGRLLADPRAAARANATATAALLAGELTRAARLFREALRADRRSPAAWRGLGLAYEGLGRPQAARRAYGHYLSLAPRAADAPQVRDRVSRLSLVDGP